MDDRQVWERIVGGDVVALRILHDKYYYQLWLYANKFTQDRPVAEELVADCFIKLWDRRKYISIEKSLKSYLFLMLRNQIVSQFRKNKAHILIDIHSIPDIPDDAYINNYDFYADLYRAIQKIPEQRRKILELAAFESLTYKEIANRLDISVNTVKTQMGRAYQFLKEELDPKSILLLSLLQNKQAIDFLHE
jgi:RNA polymerase sigma-70 factor (ECF subfamily)